jgi:hypothetical protein
MHMTQLSVKAAGCKENLTLSDEPRVSAASRSQPDQSSSHPSGALVAA